jgi:hypothetical protein
LRFKGVLVSLDDSLQKALSLIPECLAAGYVDLTTGMLLGIETIDSHPQEVLDFLAAATSDLFQGPNVTAIEKVFKKVRGKEADAQHYFQEIIVMSENLVHVFLRSRKNSDQVAAFVCRKAVNLGMAVTKARMAMEIIEAAA